MPKGISVSGFISWSTDKNKTVFKGDIHTGDVVYIRTLNSLYTLSARDDGTFLVSGGWFDKYGRSPFVTRINGCTYGGSMINIAAVASCGLCVEFGNRVRTSPIRKIMIIQHARKN